MEELENFGFTFEGEEEEKRAAAEAKKVTYIESKLNYGNIEGVLAVYNKIAEKQMFTTPIGLSYTTMLYQFLMKNGKQEELLPILIKTDKEKTLQEKALKEEIADVRQKFKYAFCSAIVLAVMVVAMFLITIRGTTPNMLNYEQAIQNKYSTWEEELLKREQKIREFEKDQRNLSD